MQSTRRSVKCMKIVLWLLVGVAIGYYVFTLLNGTDHFRLVPALTISVASLKSVQADFLGVILQRCKYYHDFQSETIFTVCFLNNFPKDCAFQHHAFKPSPPPPNSPGANMGCLSNFGPRCMVGESSGTLRC